MGLNFAEISAHATPADHPRPLPVLLSADTNLVGRCVATARPPVATAKFRVDRTTRKPKQHETDDTQATIEPADSIPMAQGHRGRGGARVGGVGADFGSAPPRAAACASGGLGYREGESRGGARSFCDRRGWVRCAAPPIFRASGAREVALISLSYV